MAGLGEWRGTQVLGSEAIGEVEEEDIITAMDFNNDGTHLAIGDKGGRVMVFENTHFGYPKISPNHFQFLTEFQSHVRQFDFLKSIDISQQVNCLQWLPSQGKNLYLLSSSDKIIKLWKVSLKYKKEVVNSTSNSSGATSLPAKDGSPGPNSKVVLPKMRVTHKFYNNTLKLEYSNLHNYHINSISLSSNQENFLSADDLRIYLWNLEKYNEAYNLVDLRPSKIENVKEVITACKFHTLHDYEFAFSTNDRRLARMDLRMSPKGGPISTLLVEPKSYQPKNKSSTLDYDEIIRCVTDFAYSSDGTHIFARDLLSVKVWDLRQTSKPASSIDLFKPSFDKLDSLYNNEAIYEKFKIALSPSGGEFITGSFHGIFMGDQSGKQLFHFETKPTLPANSQDSLFFGQGSISKSNPLQNVVSERVLVGQEKDLQSEFSRRVIHLSWNSHQPQTIAAACRGSVFFLNKPTDAAAPKEATYKDEYQEYSSP